MSVMEIFLHPYFLLPALIWTTAITGYALWRSARSRHKIWFIILLLVHTLGILELIYLFTHPKRKAHKKPKPSAFTNLTAPSNQLTTQHQAIVYVLTGILDEEHQTSITQSQIQRAVQLIEERIHGKLSQKQLQTQLDKPEAKGGVGLYKQTAAKIASHIEAILKATKK